MTGTQNQLLMYIPANKTGGFNRETRYFISAT